MIALKQGQSSLTVSMAIARAKTAADQDNT
jgi:hypothetical protein